MKHLKNPLYFFKRLDFLRLKQDSEFIKSIINVSSEKDKKSNFFKISTSDYIIDAVSKDLENKFPQVNFGQLRKLHERIHKEIIGLKLNMKSLFGIFLGLGTMIMRTVPKAVITQFCWNYDTFQIYTFWITIAFLAYLGLVFSPWIIIYYKEKKLHNWIGEILSYTEIRKITTNKSSEIEAD